MSEIYSGILSSKLAFFAGDCYLEVTGGAGFYSFFDYGCEVCYDFDFESKAEDDLND